MTLQHRNRKYIVKHAGANPMANLGGSRKYGMYAGDAKW